MREILFRGKRSDNGEWTVIAMEIKNPILKLLRELLYQQRMKYF